MDFQNQHNTGSQQIQPTNIGQWIIDPTPNGTGGLMLSGFSMSQDIPLLHKMGIGAVLSIVVQNQIESNRYELPIVGRIHQIEDDDWQDIGKVLPDCFEFIQQQITRTNVLVHCIAGISRSPTVVAYYLIRLHGWTFEEALTYIRSKRPMAKPRKAFIEQLLKLTAHP